MKDNQTSNHSSINPNNTNQKDAILFPSNPSTRDTFPLQKTPNAKLLAPIMIKKSHDSLKNIPMKLFKSKSSEIDQDKEREAIKQIIHHNQKPATSTIITQLPRVINPRKGRSQSQRKQKVNHSHLLVESVLKKDQGNWINILKSDGELKQLWEEALVDTSEEAFVNEYFFSDPTFRYKLEILNLEDMIENSKLPVFSVRKGHTSIKTLKDNLFKNEIKRRLLLLRYHKDFTRRYTSLINRLDNHMDKLIKYDDL